MANKKVSQLTSKPSVLVTDLFPIADPSTGQLYKTTISDLGTAIGSGVSSVNALVGAVVLDTDDIQELVSPTNKWFTDTRARAALSASSPLTYNSGTGAFGIQVANGSQNGYLSSTDWTTFNAKQAALSGTGFVKISGTTISYDNSTYLTTSAAASTYLALAGGTLTGALNGTSATFTGDLTISSTNPRIYLTDTDNNPDYFISNTDGTFTVYDVTNSTARFTIGTTGNANFRNAIIGGGSITGESIYSNGIVSVGTSLSVGTTITAGGSITATRLILSGGTSPTGLYFGHTDRVVLANYTTGGGIDFETNGGTINMTLFSSGNLGIGASLTDDATNKLQVAGTLKATGATLTGALSGTSATFSGGGFTTTLTGNDIQFSRAGTAYITAIGTGSSLNFGTNNTNSVLVLASTGAATFSSSVTAGGKLTVAGGGTNNILVSENNGAVTIPTNGLSVNTGYGVGYIENRNGGNYADLYYSASKHLFTAGNVGIGTTAPTTYSLAGRHLELNDAGGGYAFYHCNTTSVKSFFASNEIGGLAALFTFSSHPLTFGTANTERMRITSAGFLGLNQTSPSQRLDVSGAIRSGVGVSNGASIAKATGRTLYKVMVSSNYDAGGAVRGGEWNVLLSNEGDAVTNTTQIYVYNNQTATFSVSGGNLIINGLNSGNTICAVYTD